MRSVHQRVRETKKFLSLSSSRLCLKGWGSSSLENLQVCSCADPGSSQLGTPVAKRCCRVFLEVYRVARIGSGLQNKPVGGQNTRLCIIKVHQYHSRSIYVYFVCPDLMSLKRLLGAEDDPFPAALDVGSVNFPVQLTIYHTAP